MAANLNSETVTLSEYDASDLGAPFKIILCNAVKQTRDNSTGEVLSTTIPNVSDLRKEIALARCLESRRLSPTELKYIRKLIKVPAKELARQLGVSAEHFSRCEAGERTLSISAEKLLRVLVLKERHSITELAHAILSHATETKIDAEIIEELKSSLIKLQSNIDALEQDIFNGDLTPVHDVNHDLVFHLGLAKSRSRSERECDPDDEKWEKQKYG